MVNPKLVGSFCLTLVFSASSLQAEQGLAPREVFRRSISDGSGDIFLLPERGNYLLDNDELTTASWHQTSHIPVAGKADRVLPPHADGMHGYAWDYDTHIPLIWHDTKQIWIRRGTYSNLAVQQDIAPTLAAILGISAPAKSEGRILKEGLEKPSAKPPRAVLVIVQDQTGWQFLNAHRGAHPFIDTLMREGANFTHAFVAHVDVETAIGHAAIATGAYPRGHGVTSNKLFNGGTWTVAPVFNLRLDENNYSRTFTGNYSAPTLADEWVRAQSGKPIILAFCGAERAAVAMGGHGSMFPGNPKPYVVYYSEKGATAGTFMTDPRFFSRPESFAGLSINSYVQKLAPDGTWYEHGLIGTEGKINYILARSTPAQVQFESDLMDKALDELPIGADTTTDLLWLNFKSTDFCGHSFGYESRECGDVLSTVDKSLQRVVEKLRSKTNDELLVVFTADHGAAPLPELSGAVRLDRQKLMNDMNARFDHHDNKISPVLAISSSQIYLNRAELTFNGFGVEDVVGYLKTYQGTMASPFNAVATEWLAKGKKKSQRFFRDVVSRDELQRTSPDLSFFSNHKKYAHERKH